MFPAKFIVNRRLDTNTSNYCLKTPIQEFIDYKKIAQLPYLEIREAIDLFTGVTDFNYIWKILSKKEKAFLQRDKVFYKGASSKNDQLFKWKNDLYKEFIRMNNNPKTAMHCHVIEITPEELFPGSIFYDYHETDSELQTYNSQELHPYILQRLDSSAPPKFDCKTIENELKLYYLKNEYNLYLCKTEFLLYWALFHGILLPEKLQAEFKINQAKTPILPIRITEVHHTQIQAIAQLLILEDNKLLSMKNVINRMERLFTEDKIKKYGDLEWPLEAIFYEKLYFKDEKSTVLYRLIKEIHPNPIGKGRPKKGNLSEEKSCLLKEIPNVFFQTRNRSLVVNYQKLGVIVQTLGYLLYGLKIISNQKEALTHPAIHHYLQSNSFLHQYAKFCLNPVCPP